MKRTTAVIAASAMLLALGACTDVKLSWNRDDGAMTVTADAPIAFSSEESVTRAAERAMSAAQEELGCAFVEDPKFAGEAAKIIKVIQAVVSGMPKRIVVLQGTCLPTGT